MLCEWAATASPILRDMLIRSGREALEAVYAHAFRADAALVRRK